MKEVSIKIFLKLFAGRIGTGCMFLDPALVFSNNNSCVQRCPYSIEGHSIPFFSSQEACPQVS
jgi:hypothetical protein